MDDRIGQLAMIDVTARARRAETPLADPELEKLTEGHQYRRFLYWLVRDMKPAAALEIGVHRAECSALMAAACRDTMVVGLDNAGLIPESAAWAYGNFRFLFCDSLGAVPVVRELLGRRKLGVVFQDSSHHAEPSRLEWEYYQPLLAADFVWVCHDVAPSFRLPDEPRSMVDYFDALPGTKTKFGTLAEGNVVGVVMP